LIFAHTIYQHQNNQNIVSVEEAVQAYAASNLLLAYHPGLMPNLRAKLVIARMSGKRVVLTMGYPLALRKLPSPNAPAPQSCQQSSIPLQVSSSVRSWIQRAEFQHFTCVIES
jgi:hypothetical protein